jgi:hypothetical protein
MHDKPRTYTSLPRTGLSSWYVFSFLFLVTLYETINLVDGLTQKLKKINIKSIIKTNYEMNPEHFHSFENRRDSATIQAKFLLRSTVTSSVKFGVPKIIWKFSILRNVI